MVGRDMAHRYPDRVRNPGEVLMEVRGWSVGPPRAAWTATSIRDVAFTVRKGEIVGIAGLMGSGRTELAMSLFGRSWGRDVRGRGAHRRAAGGPLHRAQGASRRGSPT